MHFSCMQVTIFVKSNKKFTNTFVRIFFNKYVKIITYKQLPIWATLVAVVNPMSDFRCKSGKGHGQRTGMVWYSMVYHPNRHIIGHFGSLPIQTSWLVRAKPNITITKWQSKQELSYRKQIARQLRTQYVEGFHRPKYYTVTLKSRSRVTQGPSRSLETESLDRSYSTYSRVIWR